jgi:hypothetical protein
VRNALKHDEQEDDREERMLREVWTAEGKLDSGEDRVGVLAELARRWKTLSDTARRPEDSAERRLARRVLSGLSVNLRSKDADYLKIVAQYRRSR